MRILCMNLFTVVKNYNKKIVALDLWPTFMRRNVPQTHTQITIAFLSSSFHSNTNNTTKSTNHNNLSTIMMTQQPITSTGPATILVTGGSGLVGKAIQHVITNSDDPRFGKRDNETWIFATSKDADLR